MGKWKALSLVPAIVLAAAGTAITAAPVYAACHAFTIAVNPGTVTEGGGTTATISRDGNLSPSSVQVDSVDETAVAGRDYTAIHQRVSFNMELSMTIPVSTIHNPAHEGSQTFRLQLSSGMSCVNPNYSYGPPARVTITDIDPAPAPAPVQSHPPTVAAPAPSPRASAIAASAAPSPAASVEALAPSPSPSPDATPSTVPSPVPAASPAKAGGSPLLVVIAVVVLAAAAGAGAYWYRRRSAAL